MHQTNNARFLDLLWRHVLSLGLLTVAFLVSYSRYRGRESPCPTPCPLGSSWILGPYWTSLWTRVPEPVGQGCEEGPRPLILFYLFIFIFLFLAALGLHCCTRAFSSCGERGLLFVAVGGLLLAVASLAAEHGL